MNFVVLADTSFEPVLYDAYVINTVLLIEKQQTTVDQKLNYIIILFIKTVEKYLKHVHTIVFRFGLHPKARSITTTPW